MFSIGGFQMILRKLSVFVIVLSLLTPTLSRSEGVYLTGQQANLCLILTDGGTHKTGLTPQVSIGRNISGTINWLDFNDNAWKTSAWTTRQVTLTEDSTNKIYCYKWTRPSGDPTDQSYTMVYENTTIPRGLVSEP